MLSTRAFFFAIVFGLMKSAKQSLDAMDVDSDKVVHAMAKALAGIRANGKIDRALWPAEAVNPHGLGLVPEGEHLVLPPNLRLHDPVYLRQRLAAQSPEMQFDLALRIFDVVDSTNTQMMQSAHQQSVHKHLYAAEFQSAGRGRRGRDWHGDFAQNIAMTVGYRCNRGLSELGGLSCVVGLSLVQVLEQLGIDTKIKWPNDIWVEDRKLAGVLVELVQTQEGVTAIVGIGLNLHLGEVQRHQIEQAAISLRELGCMVARDDLVLMIYESVLRNFSVFEVEGFAVFVQAFNTVHRLHEQPAVLHLGDTQRTGVVRGLDENGGLLFEESGVVSAIAGGEISVRPAFFAKASERPLQ